MSENIVSISSVEDAEDVNSKLFGTILVSIGTSFTAIYFDDTIFLYSNRDFFDYITSILSNPRLSKLLYRHKNKTNDQLKNVTCKKCTNFESFLRNKVSFKTFNLFKQEINSILIDRRKNDEKKIIEIIQLVIKYQDFVNKKPKRPFNVPETKKISKKKKTFYNNKRDLYLLYLTIFNEILSYNGPLNSDQLLRIINNYPQLGRIKYNPITLLNDIIESGALYRDENGYIYLI